MDKITGTIKYEYQILRYRHDVVSGEFVNIGIVFFDAEKQFLRVRITEKHERISNFFGSISSVFLLHATKQIERSLNNIGQQMVYKSPHSFKSVADITNSVLPPNDNSLFFSTVSNGWHFDHKKAFDETFERLIGRYTSEKAEQRYEEIYVQNTADLVYV